MTTKERVEVFFTKVVREYSCGDIGALLAAKLEQAGPLLACTVNGIDLVGGMMQGFGHNSRGRSTAFMQKYLNLTSEESELMYSLVRCGVSHEGVTKLAIRFFVYYHHRIEPGGFLFRDDTSCVWLDVTELARSYLGAIDAIAKDLHSHLRHVPEPGSKEIATFGTAESAVSRKVEDYCVEISRRQTEPCSSVNPFFPEWLKGFTVSTTEDGAKGK